MIRGGALVGLVPRLPGNVVDVIQTRHQTRAKALSGAEVARSVPRMVHASDDAAAEDHRCSILPSARRARIGTRMAREAVSGGSSIDRSESDEGRVGMDVRAAALCVAHGLCRVVRGTQQRDGRGVSPGCTSLCREGPWCFCTGSPRRPARRRRKSWYLQIAE